MCPSHNHVKPPNARAQDALLLSRGGMSSCKQCQTLCLVPCSCIIQFHIQQLDPLDASMLAAFGDAAGNSSHQQTERVRA